MKTEIVVEKKDNRPVVLCRRDLADFGEKSRFCCKPIAKTNIFEWCEECRARLPLWPVDAAAPAADTCAFCPDRADMTVAGKTEGSTLRVCQSHIDDYRESAVAEADQLAIDFSKTPAQEAN